MEMKKVQILLSTYQGEQFLEEQIESLLAQTWKNIEILVRDDGSQDGTREILRNYSEKYKNILFYEGKNIGVTKSFFELLKKSTAEYVAFCDQDDMWLNNKIESAILKLEQETGPALYCSNKILVDDKLNPMKKQNNQELVPGFGNAVIECICTGCTAILNRKLVDILISRLPEHAILHDWWSYLVASYVGTVIFDKNAYILYRQHGKNVVGAKGGFWGNVQLKAAYLRKNQGKLKAQLSDFSRLYQGDIPKDILVQNILEAEKFSGKIKIIGNRKIYRQSVLDEVIMRILFMINRML